MFFDVHAASGSPLAKEALERFAGLYTIEAQIKGKPPDERRRCRQEPSLSLVAELKEWLETTLQKISGKSELAKAMRYNACARRRYYRLHCQAKGHDQR